MEKRKESPSFCWSLLLQGGRLLLLLPLLLLLLGGLLSFAVGGNLGKGRLAVYSAPHAALSPARRCGPTGWPCAWCCTCACARCTGTT